VNQEKEVLSRLAKIQEFTLKTDEEGCNYLIENSPENINLFIPYIIELLRKGKIKIAKPLTEQFSKKFDKMFSFYLKTWCCFLEVLGIGGEGKIILNLICNINNFKNGVIKHDF